MPYPSIVQVEVPRGLRIRSTCDDVPGGAFPLGLLYVAPFEGRRYYAREFASRPDPVVESRRDRCRAVTTPCESRP